MKNLSLSFPRRRESITPCHRLPSMGSHLRRNDGVGNDAPARDLNDRLNDLLKVAA